MEMFEITDKTFHFQYLNVNSERERALFISELNMLRKQINILLFFLCGNVRIQFFNNLIYPRQASADLLATVFTFRLWSDIVKRKTYQTK